MMMTLHSIIIMSNTIEFLLCSKTCAKLYHRIDLFLPAQHSILPSGLQHRLFPSPLHVILMS